ncbi:hypothetical protein L6R53_03470 [Myxococcota bacterium]|nr:hypothetical protein [Myxococcota bacterium]
MQAGSGAKIAGTGCGGCGCLMLLSAVVLAVLVAAGAFNYSAEGAALGGAGTLFCLGVFDLLLGGILLLVGRNAAKGGGEWT